MNSHATEPNHDDVHQHALETLLRAVFGVVQEQAHLRTALQHLNACSICQGELATLSRVFMERPPRSRSAGAAPEPLDEERLIALLDHHVHHTPLALETPHLMRYPNFGEWRALQPAKSSEAITTTTKLTRGAGYLAWLTKDTPERFIALLIALRELPKPTLQLAHRAMTNDVLYSFALLDEPQLEARLTVYADRTSEALCWAIVEVTVTERWPDNSGIEVVMRLRDREERKQSGENGQVIFYQILRDELDHATFALVMPSIAAHPTTQTAPKNADD